METKDDFNFGALLASYLKKNKISKAALARAIGKSDNNILYFQKRKSIQVSIIVALCDALKHNFFMDIAYQLPKEYSTSAIIDDSKDAQIAQLEQEIVLLKAREEVLLQAFRKG